MYLDIHGMLDSNFLATRQIYSSTRTVDLLLDSERVKSGIVTELFNCSV